jgi:methylmalonyl-CoA mutase N-terminal domain/subunit
MDAEARSRQIARLREVKESRDGARARRALDQLRSGASVDGVNLMPLLVECAHAYCSVGEMSNVLREEWGEFRQPAVF